MSSPGAAIYLRVSKDDGSMTTDNQRPDVEQMAAGRGYVVAPEHVYIDEASGVLGRADRPALDALLTAAARGKFRAVFVWALDRFSRDDDFVGGLLMIGEVARYGVVLLSHQETWVDTAGPFRDVFVHLSIKLAARERSRLRDRTNAALAVRKEKIRTAGGFWKEYKDADGAVQRRWVTALGRKRAQISDAMRARALALRSGDRAGDAPAPWRYVRARLRAEGFANVPSHATLARACTKSSQEVDGASPRGTGGSTAGEVG